MFRQFFWGICDWQFPKLSFHESVTGTNRERFNRLGPQIESYMGGLIVRERQLRTICNSLNLTD
jgi:hypothetical protein